MKKKKPKRMNSFDEIREAFMTGLKWCSLYGLDWKEHMVPIIEDGQIQGYYVLDETLSTAVKTIRI